MAIPLLTTPDEVQIQRTYSVTRTSLFGGCEDAFGFRNDVVLSDRS